MTNFANALAEAHNAELKDSNGKVNQTDRNTLRNKLMVALATDLEAIMTSDGAVVEFAHEYWGGLFLEISVKFKDPNYDVNAAEAEYLDKQEKAMAKKLDAIAKANERKAKADALKAIKSKE